MSDLYREIQKSVFPVSGNKTIFSFWNSMKDINASTVRASTC